MKDGDGELQYKGRRWGTSNIKDVGEELQYEKDGGGELQYEGLGWGTPI